MVWTNMYRKFIFIYKTVWAGQKFDILLVWTIAKPNKMVAILSTIGKPNNKGKPNRPLPLEF